MRTPRRPLKQHLCFATLFVNDGVRLGEITANLAISLKDEMRCATKTFRILSFKCKLPRMNSNSNHLVSQ